MNTVKITNKAKYNEKVIDVDLTGITSHNANGTIRGDISIETEDNGWMDFSGEHGAHDYEEEYGFVIEFKAD